MDRVNGESKSKSFTPVNYLNLRKLSHRKAYRRSDTLN